MNPALFQKLTTSEVEKYAAELELAIESHSRWLAHINRTLVCRDTPRPEDIDEAPHLLCHFGRWYQAVEDGLTRLDEFREIGEVHQQMHLTAKALLTKSINKIPILPHEYDVLIELTDRLRELVNLLRDDFKRNLVLLSQLMGKVFEHATEGVVITAPDGTIMSINQAFTEVTGYSAEEAIGQNPNLLNSGRQNQAFYDRMWDNLERSGQWQGEIWNKRKNGEIYLEWLSIAAVKDNQGNVTHYVGIFSDITTEKESEERLFRLAHYDILTNIPNRMLFYDRLRQSLARARRTSRRVAVMFLDLDGFKEVNDSLGHSAGDQLLTQVAERLSSTLRASDTVARFGGDEFTIALTDIENNEDLRVTQVAAKIIECIGEPYELEGDRVGITTSIGIAFYPTDGKEADTLITCADIAMYHAKNAGKNQFCFYNSSME